MNKLTLTKIRELNKKLESFAFIEKDLICYSGKLSIEKINDFLNIDFEEIQKKLKTITPLKKYKNDELLSDEILQELFLELGFEFKKVNKLEFFEKLQHYFEKNKKIKNQKRPLIVTIMGHVDHGKTTLLDTIRKSNITSKEIGAITQKLGAYKVLYKNKKIIFIDTPGHEFFNSMRQRGTEITDLVILLVSGTEGVKEQTVESIKLAKKSKIPIIVFVNKSDLPIFNIDNIEKKLSEFELIPSKWGGKTIFIKGSAKNNIGVNELLDCILDKEKEINPITQESNFCRAIVLDSYIGSSGPLVSVIVKSGKLKIKDWVISNQIIGCIKNLKDDKGNNLKIVEAGDCVLINGFQSTPLVGSFVYNFENSQIVKNLSEFKLKKIAEQKNKILNKSFDDMFKKDIKNKINIILKVDTKGSEEVIVKLISKLLKINTKNELNFIILDIGELNINDIKLAQKTNSFVLTYNLKIKSSIKKELKEKLINYFEYKLIYKLIEKLEEFIYGKHIKKQKINIIGKMKVTNIFVHSKFGTIAGGIVEEGVISKSKNLLRVIRNKEIIIDKQKILTIRHEKDEIDSAKTKQTCGILFLKPFKFEINDIIEQFEIIQEKNDK